MCAVATEGQVPQRDRRSCIANPATYKWYIDPSMPTNPYRQIFQALQNAGIRYLVVGGIAVNLHGYRRFTADFDILLALDPENLEKMTAYTFHSSKRDRLDIDILAGHSLQFDKYEQRRALIDVEGGLKVPVISVDDLVQMKREANRPEDLIDIDALLELQGL